MENVGLNVKNVRISDTKVRPRKDIYLFDYDCVNEAVFNALVHNDWTISEPRISMFENRLEIVSHGDLPNGMTKAQFFAGISKPRNATLMRIFLNMPLTEHTGHGVPTIVKKYGVEAFEIENNYICCTILFEKDVLDKMRNENLDSNVDLNIKLNKTEKRVLTRLVENSAYPSDELAEKLGLTKRTIERTFSALQSRNLIARVGSKRDGQWIVMK